MPEYLPRVNSILNQVSELLITCTKYKVAMSEYDTLVLNSILLGC